MGKPVANRSSTVGATRRRGGNTQNFSSTPRRGGGGNRTKFVRGTKPMGTDRQTSFFNQKWLAKLDKEKVPFAEEIMTTTFGQENVEKLVAACKTATDTEVNDSNRLLTDDYIYSIQITSHRAPHVPVHLSRVLLPHSIENADSDICLFVKDLKRGRKLDYEPTIKHYEQLLRNKKIDRNITIIPVNQLYNDYATFELRRKLTYMFDKFLVDKAVATHVNGFLGHKLLTKGRSALPIDLASENLIEEIDSTMRKVFYKHVNNGITQTVQVGRHSMSDTQIAENIIELVKQLDTSIHPGGSKNIYKLHIKPNVNISVAVPLYVDLAKPVIDTPTELGPKEKATADASAMADDTLNNVSINESGNVVQKVRAGKSIVGDNVVASDDDDDAEMNDDSEQQTPVKKQVNKRQNVGAGRKQPAASEEAINDLILKNLKKLVPALKGNANNNAGNSGAVSKRQNQNVNQRQNQNNRNTNAGGGGGGGSGGSGNNRNNTNRRANTGTNNSGGGGGGGGNNNRNFTGNNQAGGGGGGGGGYGNNRGMNNSGGNNMNRGGGGGSGQGYMNNLSGGGLNNGSGFGGGGNNGNNMGGGGGGNGGNWGTGGGNMPGNNSGGNFNNSGPWGTASSGRF